RSEVTNRPSVSLSAAPGVTETSLQARTAGRRVFPAAPCESPSRKPAGGPYFRDDSVFHDFACAGDARHLDRARVRRRLDAARWRSASLQQADAIARDDASLGAGAVGGADAAGPALTTGDPSWSGLLGSIPAAVTAARPRSATALGCPNTRCASRLTAPSTRRTR